MGIVEEWGIDDAGGLGSIAVLRRELAAKDAEIEALKRQLDKEVSANGFLIGARDSKDAEIARLREAVKPLAEWPLYDSDKPAECIAVRGTKGRLTAQHVVDARSALATPADAKERPCDNQ